MIEGENLIDVSMLQQIQDQFCSADHLYLMCVDRKNGVVTKAFGTGEEVGFLRTLVDRQTYMELVERMKNERMETVVEKQLPETYVKLCAISTRVEGKLQVVWTAAGIIEEYLTPEVELPEGTMTTTEEQFYASVEFLSFLSTQMFESRRNQLLAQRALEKSTDSELAMEHQLHRSRAMTEILQIMEEENSFEKVVEDILSEACKSLEISGGCLLKENTEEKTVDMVCEYTSRESDARIGKVQGVPKAALPFYTGKPYVISSDSMKPDTFTDLFVAWQITAGIFEPVEVQDHTAMYFCVYDNGKGRIWENSDIKFISDVRLWCRAFF